MKRRSVEAMLDMEVDALKSACPARARRLFRCSRAPPTPLPKVHCALHPLIAMICTSACRQHHKAPQDGGRRVASPTCRDCARCGQRGRGRRPLGRRRRRHRRRNGYVVG
eukprot:851287-Prymnesium_polylepis.1